MIKERFDFLFGHGRIKNPDLDITYVEEMVNSLIQSLYIPTLESHESHRDPMRCELFGVEDEAINWGDLKVIEVRRLEGGKYLVDIDEADPSCPTFAAYIEKYMSAWGWQVEVKTEW